MDKRYMPEFHYQGLHIVGRRWSNVKYDLCWDRSRFDIWEDIPKEPEEFNTYEEMDVAFKRAVRMIVGERK
jgi:hypothetical protein